MARDIALIEPDPKDWAGWVIYLLEQIGVEAIRGRRIEDYEIMIKSLLRKLSG